MLHFNCPGCRTPLRVRDEYAGRKTNCPTCGAAVVVPGAEDQMEEVPFKPASPARPVAPAEPARTPGAKGVALALAILRGLAWAACVLWSLGVALLLLIGEAQSQSAVQEASGAAMACFWLIFGYVCARAVDSATRW